MNEGEQHYGQIVELVIGEFRSLGSTVHSNGEYGRDREVKMRVQGG